MNAEMDSLKWAVDVVCVGGGMEVVKRKGGREVF